MSNSTIPETARREFMKIGLAASMGVSLRGWFPQMARSAEKSGKMRHKSCILLWMNGGPTQTDTFDLKTGHANAGPLKPIETAAPGIQISEHLPILAKQFNDLSIIRSLTSSEGDHQRGTQLMMTGYRPRGGTVNYPVLGSIVANELDSVETMLPNFVSISSFRFAQLGSGFLGPRYAPLNVSGRSDDPSARANLSIENLSPTNRISEESIENRFSLLSAIQRKFGENHKVESAASHSANYEKAFRMVRTKARNAFQLDEEPASLRDAYGRNRFGQGCLLARRLVERHVPFVEVTLSQDTKNALAWDTHNDNFNRVESLCGTLDSGWGTLMADLKDRGLLDSTLVIWMGEFGRTPRINQNTGRDHFPLAWSSVLGGAGINGGQLVGNTGADGMRVTDRPVKVPEFYATIYQALGIDHQTENVSREGRPIGIVDGDAQPVKELLT